MLLPVFVISFLMSETEWNSLPEGRNAWNLHLSIRSSKSNFSLLVRENFFCFVVVWWGGVVVGLFGLCACLFGSSFPLTEIWRLSGCAGACSGAYQMTRGLTFVICIFFVCIIIIIMIIIF